MEGKERQATTVLQPGVASIKAEFLLKKTCSDSTSDELQLSATIQNSGLDSTHPGIPNSSHDNDEAINPPPAKRKKRRGQNKHRPRSKIPFSEMLCPSLHIHSDKPECPFSARCRYTHDVATYMLTKPPDIGDTCYNFQNLGRCPYGLACRFGSSHLSSNYENQVNLEIFESDRVHTLNVLSKSLQEELRRRKVDFPDSEAYLEKLASNIPTDVTKTGTSIQSFTEDVPKTGTSIQSFTEDVPKTGTSIQSFTEDVPKTGTSIQSFTEDVPKTGTSIQSFTEDVPKTGTSIQSFTEENARASDGAVAWKTYGPMTDEDSIKLRQAEKKKVDFRDKLYLAPLTTVGNLPFRRICKELGADITCGEMAMATNLLQGQQSEWALIKRHESEDVFGVQICGCHANTMTRCAELINKHAKVDFVDINTGCPLDLVCNKGAGCALMGRHTRFETIVRGMVEVLHCPLTVKMRAGMYNKNWNAHLLAPKLCDWGVSLVTIHGRSREQRYTRLADWQYINDCVKAAHPLPVFGNGDILSFQDYNRLRCETEVAGTMIARGALVKPWIFTEIKEQRDWDISSSERFDILKRYTNYGLQHWGSDTQGVENMRRFLLEWLSFLYRYIPVGVLERLPQRLNERPPLYCGRDDLETLMTSNNCRDWIKISEMLLGPVPSNFTFLPKHKANAY